MSFNEGADLDLSGVESGGSGGGLSGLAGGLVSRGGLGLGAIVLIVIAGQIFGVDVGQFLGGGGGTTSTQSVGDLSRCQTGKDANEDDQCRVIGARSSIQAYWAKELPKYGKKYIPANLVSYSGTTQSACGPASNAVGPFYCPADRKIYIDASFFAELTSRYGADGGALAQEYVVAHEYGHYIEDLLGFLDRGRDSRQGPTSAAVRIELMADCLAGMWAKGAAETKDRNGDTFLQPLTQKDIDSALSAASAVGDDKIQEKTQGQVNPESWTHGSSEQRQRWFTVGYTTGDLNRCNTFNAKTL